LLLAACGGGGVSTPGTNAPPVATPTPAPTPAPPPTPTPTPPPTAADGAEYKASAAVVGARAAYAYDRGITGKGVTIAVIDTGIAVNGPEFTGRISPDSKAFENRIARCPTCAPETVTFALDDLQGHGTETASVALAAKNGSRCARPARPLHTRTRPTKTTWPRPVTSCVASPPGRSLPTEPTMPTACVI
jgi:subtilisin family serine protease